jgi:hypothetical protein
MRWYCVWKVVDRLFGGKARGALFSPQIKRAGAKPENMTNNRKNERDLSDTPRGLI